MLASLLLAPLGMLAPRALRRLDAVRDALHGRPWVFVDGNNVRGAAGWRLGAAELTEAIDSWADESGLRDRVVTVWDSARASGPSARLLPRGSAVAFSGGRQLADDVLVQAVGLVGSQDDDVVLFSSDNALRGRCYAQLEMRRQEPRGAALKSLHSLYLAWLLQAQDPARWAEASPVTGGRAAHGARRGEADALADALATAGEAGVEEDGRSRPQDLRALVRWLDAPTGLSVERRSRKGNVLYRYGDE